LPATPLQNFGDEPGLFSGIIFLDESPNRGKIRKTRPENALLPDPCDAPENNVKETRTVFLERYVRGRHGGQTLKPKIRNMYEPGVLQRFAIQ